MAKHSINDFLRLCNSCETCGYGMGKEIINDAGIIVDIEVQVFLNPGRETKTQKKAKMACFVSGMLR